MNNTTTRTKFSLATQVQGWWRRQREAGRQQALRQRCPPATVAASQIPDVVRAAWSRQAPAEFPGLAVDDGAWLRSTLGLAQFFEACRLQHGQGPCALPSKAADAVWHAWLQADPASLSAWQRRYFDREVPHQDAQSLGAPLEECLARTWAGACRSEGLSLVGPQLPLVFALDDLLRLPTGWAYSHERGALVHRQIDGFGQASGPVVTHAAVAASSLVALGLLSQTELDAALRRRDSDGGTVSSPSSSPSSSPDGSCDAGSSGSCDGGSSCGSSCGGGGD